MIFAFSFAQIAIEKLNDSVLENDVKFKVTSIDAVKET